jgi:hypothetical protein
VTFFGCCAPATAPPMANVKARVTRPTNFRFWIFDFGLPEKKLETRVEEITFMLLVP